MVTVKLHCLSHTVMTLSKNGRSNFLRFNILSKYFQSLFSRKQFPFYSKQENNNLQWNSSRREVCIPIVVK